MAASSPGVPGALLSIDHLALPIFEVEKSLQFYLNTLGLPLVAALAGDDWGGKPWLMMTFGLGQQRQLVLIALRGALREQSTLPRDTRHFAFAVETLDALLTWKQRLDVAGVANWEEDHDSQRSVYFEDPNGIVLEITTPPSWQAMTTSTDARTTVESFIASERG